jgi:hypothetical protein
MPGNLLHVGAIVTCPHGGQATPQPAQSRAGVSGQPVVTLTHTYTIAGCPFVVGNVAQPCLTIRWTSPSGRVQVGGAPALTLGSVGLCLGPTQAPQGTAVISAVQTRAVAQ